MVWNFLALISSWIYYNRTEIQEEVYLECISLIKLEHYLRKIT